MADFDDFLKKLKPYVLRWAQPPWQAWTPTPAGWSANPTDTSYRYMLIGSTCWFAIRQATAGTSNATTATLTLPFTAKTISNAVWIFPAAYVDNGTAAATPGRGIITSGGSTIVFGVAWNASGGFTASNGKGIVSCDGFYEIA